MRLNGGLAKLLVLVAAVSVFGAVGCAKQDAPGTSKAGAKDSAPGSGQAVGGGVATPAKTEETPAAAKEEAKEETKTAEPAKEEAKPAEPAKEEAKPAAEEKKPEAAKEEAKPEAAKEGDKPAAEEKK